MKYLEIAITNLWSKDLRIDYHGDRSHIAKSWAANAPVNMTGDGAESGRPWKAVEGNHPKHKESRQGLLHNDLTILKTPFVAKVLQKVPVSDTNPTLM